MLGFVTVSERGEGDRLLIRVAQRMAAAAISVGGVVQINSEIGPDQPCQMDLQMLSDGSRINISQNLGRHSGGCRLDPAGLEGAVGQVAATLVSSPPQLLLLNKFGKQEAEGRGFRPVIGQALALEVCVLICVSDQYRAAFDLFAGDFATALTSTEDSVMQWCVSQIGTLNRY